MQSSEADRKGHLDGLRGVAACVVFFGHLSIALTGGTWIFKGNAAVCIFFVLSGYVLSELAQHSPLSFPAQAVRRYLRLIGPMLMTSTFAWALLALGAYRNQQAAELIHNVWLGSWYKFEPSFSGMLSETVYGVFVSGQSDYNCNLWTMRPELIGSLYLLLINAIAPGRRLRTLCYLALGLFHSDEYIVLFPVGALLHDYHSELAGWVKATWLKAALFVVSLYLCVAPTKWIEVFHRTSSDGLYWNMLGAALLVWSVLHWHLLQSLLDKALGRLLGRISFTLYLIHVPIICSLTAWLVLLLPSGLAIPAAATTTVAAVFLASIAIYRWTDQIPTRWSRSAGYLMDSLFRDKRPLPEFSPSTELVN